MRVRVALRRRGGSPRTIGVRVPVPRDLRPGRRTLVIEGNGFSLGEEEILIEIVDGLSRGGPTASAAPLARMAQSEPRSVRGLARQVAALATRRASRPAFADASRAWSCARATCASTGA